MLPGQEVDDSDRNPLEAKNHNSGARGEVGVGTPLKAKQDGQERGKVCHGDGKQASCAAVGRVRWS